jgi:hypothetical protein
MINDYLRRIACIEFVRESLIQGEFLSLSFSYSSLTFYLVYHFFVHFIGLTVFSSFR